MSGAQSPLPLGPSSSAAPLLDALLRHAPARLPGVRDELRAADGSVRPLWRRFAALMPEPADGVPMDEDLDRRVRQIAQQLHQDGVTHNVFSDEGVAQRAWSLELLPMLIDAVEWAEIEAGVKQRAELLERVLADVYGDGRLLQEGLLPGALLMRHPGYLRGLQGVRPAGGQYLHLAAFDIARDVDGRWWLVAQRTQGPSGLGYVMHNRRLVSRQFPDAFRELRVQHLASGYRRLIDALVQRAQVLAGHASPRVVLLTPGRFSETYFEQTYLARYLGLPLVEGGDLTVRGDRLFMMTVDGLEPVHGVLRRLDDHWCDPLELRPDSALGVPGLLGAVRAGQVVMANALGSAFLETPALQGFLPAIARRLLGDELRMPALPTWWCGETAAWEAARGRLAGQVLRATFPADGRTSRAAPPGSDPAALVAADPDAWTVQSRLRFSRAPQWQDGRMLPCPAMLRVYAVADAAGRWQVLPGGMTRTSRGETSSLSMQRGGSSLDTWVLADGPVDAFTMLPGRLSVDDIARRRRPVGSRTGEHLFWLGRYTERAEQIVRLARVILTRIDADDTLAPALQETLSQLAVRRGLVPPGVPTMAQAPHVFERALLSSLGDVGGATSVGFDLHAIVRNAQALRDRMAVEPWRLVCSMRDDFDEGIAAAGPALPSRAAALALLDTLALQLAALTGAQTDRMNRDHGWRLLSTGRLIERLHGVSVRMEAFLQGQVLADAAGVELLLELFDSAISFRARYQRHDDLLALVDVLVLDPSNPRSFAGVLRRLRRELGKLPGDEPAPLLARLPAEGAGLTLESLRGASDADIAQRVAQLARRLDQAGQRLAEDIGERYFALAHEAHALRRV